MKFVLKLFLCCVLLASDACSQTTPPSSDTSSKGRSRSSPPKQQILKQGGGCDLACVEEINHARDYTEQVYEDLKKKNEAAVARLNVLEERLDYYLPVLEKQILEVAKDLKGNISSLDSTLNYNFEVLVAEDNKFIKRLDELEKKSQGGTPDYGYDKDLAQKVAALERYLPGNVSELHWKIQSELDIQWGNMKTWVTNVENALITRINNLAAQIPSATSHPHTNPHPQPDHGNQNNQALEVYHNLTRKIDGLEHGKVQQLMDKNELWRKNFKSINATFECIRKNKRVC